MAVVLGIHWEQNSGASLFIDGKLKSALSEERCSKVKNDERYPYKAIEKILKENDVQKKDISVIAIA